MASRRQTNESETALRELGIDSAQPPETIVAQVKAAHEAGNHDPAVIARALGAAAAPEAAAILAGMEANASGVLRREIRRSLFRLHQRGINPPETRHAAPARDRGDDLQGLLSPIDAEGARIAWLIKPRAGGGLRRLWGLVSEGGGMIGATADTLSRKELRADRARIEQRAGAPLIEANWRLVDFIMCEAYRRTPEARRAPVGSFLTARAEMTGESPPTDFRHPVYDEFASELEAEPSPDLMKEPEVAAYKLPEDVIKPFADEAAGLQQSVIVLNRMQQQDRLNTIVERAIGELLTGDNAYRMRRHLEETAYYFARLGKRREAGWAAAAAARIRDGADLRHIAFFQLFMRAQVGAIMAEEDAERREEPRLIMTPAEAMRAQQAARMRQRR